MANPHQSECRLNVDGADYTLVYNWNSICSIENDLKTPIGELGLNAANPSNWSANAMRSILFWGLKKHHAGLSLEDAGNIIATLGGLSAMVPVLQAALKLAFPEIGEELPQNPPNAAPVTGSQS